MSLHVCSSLLILFMLVNSVHVNLSEFKSIQLFISSLQLIGGPHTISYLYMIYNFFCSISLVLEIYGDYGFIDMNGLFDENFGY